MGLKKEYLKKGNKKVAKNKVSLRTFLLKKNFIKTGSKKLS